MLSFRLLLVSLNVRSVLEAHQSLGSINPLLLMRIGWLSSALAGKPHVETDLLRFEPENGSGPPAREHPTHALEEC